MAMQDSGQIQQAQQRFVNPQTYPHFPRDAGSVEQRLGQARHDPPPYPGSSRGYQHAGYRQSYASSEAGSTDPSLSSNENLCPPLRRDITQGYPHPFDSSQHRAHVGQGGTPPVRGDCGGMGGGEGFRGHPAQNTLTETSGQSPTAVEVKSANSSTFYLTGNNMAPQDEVNLTSYTAMPHMLYNPSSNTPPQGASLPSGENSTVDSGFYSPPSLPPSCPGTPGTPDQARGSLGLQMGLYSDQTSSTPSTPDHPERPCFLNMGPSIQQHGRSKQQRAYSNQYYNCPSPALSNMSLSSQQGGVAHGNQSYGGGLMHETKQSNQHDYSTNHQTSSRLIDGSHDNQYPQQYGPQSDMDAAYQRPNEEYQRSHNSQSQQNNSTRHFNSNQMQEPLNAKHDPYNKKWRHVYVNQKSQKSQFSQYKMMNQLLNSRDIQNIRPDEIQSEDEDNLNALSAPNKLAKSMSGSQLGGNQPRHLENVNVSNIRVTDRLRSATPDMTSERPSISRQLPLRPSSASAAAKQVRGIGNNKFNNGQAMKSYNQDINTNRRHNMGLPIAQMKHTQPQPRLTKDSPLSQGISTNSLHQKPSPMQLQQQQFRSDKMLKKVVPSSSSGSTRDDAMSTISTMSSMSNMSTSSSEMEPTRNDLSRIMMNRQRSNSGGNGPNRNSAKSLKNDTMKNGNAKNSQKQHFYPADNLNKYAPDNAALGPQNKSSSMQDSSSTSVNSAFHAARNRFTEQSSSFSRKTHHFEKTDHNSRTMQQAELSRNTSQSRSASRLQRPRTAPPHRSSEKALKLSPASQKYQHDYNSANFSPPTFRNSKIGNNLVSSSPSSIRKANYIGSSNRINKELSRSCEILNQSTGNITENHQDSTHISGDNKAHRNMSPGTTFYQHVLDDGTTTSPKGSLDIRGAPKPSSCDRTSEHLPCFSSHQAPNQLNNNQDNSSKLSTSSNGEVDHAAIATRATQMVERLAEENHALSQDLEKQRANMKKFESELEKVTDAYQKLVKHSQKQESLERQARFKLASEIKKLSQQNKQLKEHLALESDSSMLSFSDSEMKFELKEKDAMISTLFNQNRELNKSKERVEIQLAGEKVRNEERQNHVSVLEKALKSCQAQVFKQEEELARLKIRETKIEQLQSALNQFRVATEKRESIEQKLRHKLEEEIRLYKQHKGNKCGSKASDTDEGISSDSESPTRMHSLMRQVSEREQQVLKLESQVAHWQQKYHEQGALRILEVESTPTKESPIMSRDLHESARLIEESRTDQLRHLEEVYKAKKSAAELEARVKTLELQLAERDAMVRILSPHHHIHVTSGSGPPPPPISSLSPASSHTSLVDSQTSSPTVVSAVNTTLMNAMNNNSPANSSSLINSSSDTSSTLLGTAFDSGRSDNVSGDVVGYCTNMGGIKQQHATSSVLNNSNKKPPPLATTVFSAAAKRPLTSSVCVHSPLTPQLHHRDINKVISHSKSNSEGAVLDLSSATPLPSHHPNTIATNQTSNQTPISCQKNTQPQAKHDKLEPTLLDLRQKLIAQAAIFQDWQKGEPSDIQKEVYQV